MKYKAGLEGLENGTTWFVQDPVNAATGNFIKSNTDITIDGYNPLSFTRFYNTDENGNKTNYQYDKLDRLISVTDALGAKTTYTYDTVGNRVRKENWVCSTFIDASDYQYDLQNRLTNINTQGVQMPCKKPLNQSIKMEYDQRGNLIKITNGKRVLNQYTFDTANRLSEATNVLGIKTNFNYDGAGRRTKIQITLPKPPKCFQPGFSSLFNSKNQANEKDISSWLYNGKDYKVEYNYVLDITEPYENVLMIYGKGIDTQRYTYGLDVLSLDTWNKSLSTWNQNCAKAITAKKADRSYYLQDELGSPIRIIGEAGNTKARYSYDAFGRPIIPVNLISRSKTKGNIYSYTGYQYDLSTGLMYAQARYYMPEVGRFISADAYKGTVTDPQSLNLYVYCRNNPVNYVDPSGNFDVGLRDSAYDWGGKTHWDEKTRTATVSANRKSITYKPDNDSGLRIENDRIIIDSDRFLRDFDLYDASRSSEQGRYYKCEELRTDYAGAGVQFVVMMAVLHGGYRFVPKSSLITGGAALYPTLEKGVNFTQTTAQRMQDPNRFVPVQTLINAIKNGVPQPDPQGSRAMMYYIEMFKNGKAYQLEVLYDSVSNTIWHFLYK